MKVLDELTSVLSEAFKECGYDEKLGKVTISNRPDLCQFQCNGAMAGAKLYKKAPAMIANEIADKLKDNEIFSKIEVSMPGFININISDEKLLEFVSFMNEDKNLGIEQIGAGKTAIVDYGGPNVAKPLHVGHIRSAIIGEAVKRLARTLGYNAIGDIHLGDWGLQMGLIIAQYAEEHPESKYLDEDYTGEYPELNITIDELNDIYPKASARSKVDEDFMQKAQQITFDLQKGKRGYIAFWKEIMKISVNDMKKSYKKLNVEFELWLGESDSEKYIPDMIEKFIKDGYAYESEGALIVDVAKPDDKAPMPPVIVRKRNGSQIYATTDLATIVQRIQDFNPATMLYFTDNRQGLHFEQVFRCARKTGLVDDSVELEWNGFGTMNGKDGKPYKTRDGGVMRLSDLIDNVVTGAKEKIADSENMKEYSQEEKDEIARKVGVAALKFGDLINHRSKDYVFDLDRFLSFEGKTGPYLLYTIVRINSILNKAEGMKFSELQVPQSESERNLMLKLIHLSDNVEAAMKDRAPSVICENAYVIASEFNKFYYENKIISESDEEKRGAWLTLCAFVKKVLEKHMDILAIEVPERM